jgi:glucosyl-3-phosphoglycerate synthase
MSGKNFPRKFCFPGVDSLGSLNQVRQMADFFQTGSVATLHRLGVRDHREIEMQLMGYSRDCPIALVLPLHVRDLDAPALDHILETLSNIPYLGQIVVGVDGADEEGWQRAKERFALLPQKPVLLWNDGPRITALLETLKDAEIETGPAGKGRNIWLCCGYVLASDTARMIAIHDCDIRTYHPELPARLCYPVAHPHLGFDFCKGYAARFSDQLNGRVMRLMLTPLIRSLTSIIGENEFLQFLDSFRYPLAGEVSLGVDVLRRMELPSNWGVEVGMLAEAFRVLSPNGICQVEIAERYDHKHQDLSVGDASRGLNRMAVDIANCIFLKLAGHGVKLDRGLFDTLLSVYARTAEDTMRWYAADALINGLKYNRHSEQLAVQTFSGSIRLAANAYLENPISHPVIPDWNCVESAVPDLFARLLEAVEG